MYSLSDEQIELLYPAIAEAFRRVVTEIDETVTVGDVKRQMVEAIAYPVVTDVLQRMIADAEAELTPPGSYGNRRVDDELHEYIKRIKRYLPARPDRR